MSKTIERLRQEIERNLNTAIGNGISVQALMHIAHTVTLTMHAEGFRSYDSHAAGLFVNKDTPASSETEQHNKFHAGDELTKSNTEHAAESSEENTAAAPAPHSKPKPAPAPAPAEDDDDDGFGDDPTPAAKTAPKEKAKPKPAPAPAASEDDDDDGFGGGDGSPAPAPKTKAKSAPKPAPSDDGWDEDDVGDFF